MQTLQDHINEHFSGSPLLFANSLSKNTSKQQINEWLRHGGYRVVDNTLLLVRRNNLLKPHTD